MAWPEIVPATPAFQCFELEAHTSDVATWNLGWQKLMVVSEIGYGSKCWYLHEHQTSCCSWMFILCSEGPVRGYWPIPKACTKRSKHLVMILSQMIKKFRYSSCSASNPCVSAIQAKKWNLQVVANSRHQPALGLGLPIYCCLPEAPWLGPRCFDKSLMEWAWPSATLGKLAMPMWVSIIKKEPPRLAPFKTKKALPLRFLIVDRIRVTAFGRFCVYIYIYIYNIYIHIYIYIYNYVYIYIYTHWIYINLLEGKELPF